MQHHNPQSHPHGNATHSHLRLRDSHDAHILFQAVRQGHLPLIRKRLTGPEQQALHAGQVFVWADREGSLERWTDGHNWSPSRVRGPFLMYDEMPEDTDAFLRRKAQQKAGERRVKQPRKKRLPPLPGGLSKQTYSATLIQNGVDIQKWHLTAYFKDDGNADNLITPDEDPLLRTIIVPDQTFKSSMSRKSKGSSSSRARRGSLSEHRSNATADDDDEEIGLRESPIDENSPLRTFPSPPLQPVFDPSVPFGSLPWETSYHHPGQQLRTPSSFGSPQDDNNSGGSSSGSANTERGFFLPPPSGSSPTNPSYTLSAINAGAYNRGRPMTIEGIHTRFDAMGGPAFNLSALSPPSAMSTSSDFMGAGGNNQRSLSLSGLPTADWRSYDSSNPIPSALDGGRRGSLISVDSSRSASSTSSKVPGLSAGGTSTTGGSNSSSPASSTWSQQSPYLAPANWPGVSPQQQNNMGGKFGSSPLVPGSLPSSSSSASYGNSGRSLSQLPSHIQHHPEMVQSAVPPANQSQVPGRRATLPPLLYQGDNSATFGTWNSAGYYNSPSSGQGATSTPPFPPSNGAPYVPGNLPSPFAVPSGLPSSSSSSGSSSYFPNRPLSSEPAPMKTSPTLTMHQPRAAVPPSGLPGSWEQANSSSTISFDYSTGLATSESLNSPSYGIGPPQKTIGAGQQFAGGAGPGEVFDSIVPGQQQAVEYTPAAWS
ncbi:hypothetical protein FRC04_007871 [Tulasnella sp. 424]|nr:hypothetical protein FRC04_007871 [Tulasnella sp. 424]KAG8975055.1 hypothetical protein FRC05_006478 [Tulasnella sp. 425]